MTLTKISSHENILVNLSCYCFIQGTGHMSRECTEPQKPRGGGRGRGGDRGGRGGGGHDGPVSVFLCCHLTFKGAILSQPGEVLQLPGVWPHVP